ncbi:MAG TPA: hypothetical protein VM734_25685 [Kofleriaceae bacterium]|jgi:hypothetical protein|nr:hypothetical protein [Kofleriaceae bacterium]
MGHLDERNFDALIKTGCAACGSKALELTTYVDRKVSVMYGQANDDGRWAYDGEKLIDGISKVSCVGCGQVAFASDDCPRCHAPGGLARAAAPSRLVPPRKCPQCAGTEMTLLGMAPAVVKTPAGGGRPPPPKPTALFGDDGFHVVAIACDDCDWSSLAPGCALCDAPGPLRPRP